MEQPFPNNYNFKHQPFIERRLPKIITDLESKGLSLNDEQKSLVLQLILDSLNEGDSSFHLVNDFM